MRQLILVVALTSCGPSPTEQSADSIYGCFVDDQGRAYCVDPNPVDDRQTTDQARTPLVP